MSLLQALNPNGGRNRQPKAFLHIVGIEGLTGRSVRLSACARADVCGPVPTVAPD